MRNIRTVALGLLVLAGSAVIATAQAPDKPARQRQHPGMRGMGQGQRGVGPGQLARGLFRGIQLTETERTALKSVREKYATQARAQREAMRPQMESLREARKSGDTAAVRAAREKMQQQMQQQRTQNQTLAEQAQREMRAVLTPEHQAQFDKNVAAMKERMAKRGDRPARSDAPRKRPGGRGQGRGF